MRTPNENRQSPDSACRATDLGEAFSHVYDFILQAVNGDKDTAATIFDDYLAGKLSEKLLSISRRCVSANQAHIEKEWEALDIAPEAQGAG
jgi:hypothetical protein